MQTKRQVCAATATLVGIVLGMSIPAAANELEVSDQPLVAAEDADYARTHRVTPEIAEARRQDREVFAKQLDIAYSKFGESNVDAWLDTGESAAQVFEVRVGSEDLADAVSRLLEIGGIDVNVEVRGWTLTERNETLLAELVGIPGVDGAYVDIRTGVAHVYAPDRRLSDVQAVVKELHGSEAVVESSGEGSSDTNRGGLSLTSCTSAFAAKWSSYIGFFTAAHCGSQNWQPAGTSLWNASTYRTQTYNSTADIQFRSIDNIYTLHADLWTGSAFVPIVSGSGVPVVGYAYCGRGKATGYRCGSVTSTTYTPTYAGACNGVACGPNFVFSTAVSAGGDSGGGWYSGTTGYGVNKGNVNGNAIWSKIGYRPASSNVFVG